MIDMDEYFKLKKKADQKRKESDQAQGALAQLNQQLKEEFKVDGIEGANKLVSKLEKEEKKLAQQYDAEVGKLKTEYPDVFKE